MGVRRVNTARGSLPRTAETLDPGAGSEQDLSSCQRRDGHGRPGGGHACMPRGGLHTSRPLRLGGRSLADMRNGGECHR